jgi:ribosome-binding protein aMBF1 (putative translation factor)
MKLSDLKDIDQVIEERRRDDPEFRAEWDAAAFARKVALAVVRYRTEHGISQRDLARATGIKQPAIARLENGEHTPTFPTLVKLTASTGLAFHLDVAAGDVEMTEATPHAA